MLEDAMGRLIGGAVWGLGAGVVLTLTRDGAPGLRTMTRGLIKGYLAVADRVQTATADARENLEDMTAEVRAERASSSAATEARPQTTIATTKV